eukprot:901296_1
MSSRKRNHSSMNDDMDSQPPPKRRRVSPRSQRSQRYRKSQTQSQIPGIQDAENNVFWQLLQQCKIRMYGNTSKAIELDAAESIEYYLQRKLMRDRNKRKRFITKFEEFMEYKNGERLKQCLQATVPRKNNRTLFVSAAWKNMSQINESELATISTRTQPSLIRILLNVDCLQEEVITFLQDKLDEVIMDEDEVELVLQILEQFKFLDHLVGDPQEFTKKLFDLLEIAGSIDTQSSIINLFDEIIHDEQHEFVAIKLQQLLERNPNLTEPIVGCLSQLKISHDLKKKVEVFLLESLETSSLCDLDIIIRYLLRTVDAEDVQQVMTEMRQHIPFDTEYNHKILDAFKQCIDIQKHVPVAVLSVVSDCNKNKLCCIDIWLLFILYHKKRLLTKIESLIIRKIEQQHINMKYIEKAMDNADNKQCLIEIFDAVLYLAQTMLERKNKCVSECGAALYKLLYSAMNGHAYQHKLISSITSQIGSATSVEVNNSLHLLLHLTQENQSIKLYQTPVLLLMDYMESFNKSQIRLLYEILSLLSIHIDSNNQLQLANNLLNLVTKQLGQSGFIHQQQAGIIGCIQLIYCISTKVAVIAENAKEEAGNLVQKLIEASHHNSQLFATMCDELSLMIEHSRTYKDGAVSWAQYSESHEAFHPIHHSVLKEVYDQISDYISTWCLHDDDGSDSMVTQQSQYKRNGLEAQMWLNLSGKRVNHSRGNAIDSEATEYTTDNDDESSSSSSSTFIRITPLFVAQDSEEMMWIFSPLFRLFGILSNAHLGELNSIDSFLTASLLMFNAEDLQTANMIDKSKVTRQIMGDSIFSAINCIRELLNMFCAEYIEFCTNDGNNKSQSCHSRRKRIEARLCHRLDHLVCLQHSLETFMKLNLNKQFLPSFIPSQNKEETWLNSPPWKRKLLFDQKKKKKKKLLFDDDNSNDMVSSTDEEEEEDDRNKNKKKKKKSKKKKLTDSDDDNADEEEIVSTEPKRKKRKLNDESIKREKRIKHEISNVKSEIDTAPSEYNESSLEYKMYTELQIWKNMTHAPLNMKQIKEILSNLEHVFSEKDLEIERIIGQHQFRKYGKELMKEIHRVHIEHKKKNKGNAHVGHVIHNNYNVTNVYHQYMNQPQTDEKNVSQSLKIETKTKQREITPIKIAQSLRKRKSPSFKSSFCPASRVNCNDYVPPTAPPPRQREKDRERRNTEPMYNNNNNNNNKQRNVYVLSLSSSASSSSSSMDEESEDDTRTKRNDFDYPDSSDDGISPKSVASEALLVKQVRQNRKTASLRTAKRKLNFQ